MPTNPQNTTNITFGEMYSNNVWGLGSSQKSVREKQFPNTVDALPDATGENGVWQKYLRGTLRGSIDGYTGYVLPTNILDGVGADYAFSRTFSDNSPSDVSSVVWAAGGDPACPYTPSLTSPMAGGNENAGLDYQQMPQGPNLQTLKTNGAPVGDGAWGSGDTSLTSPDTSSENQTTQGGTTSNPVYVLGKWSS